MMGATCWGDVRAARSEQCKERTRGESVDSREADHGSASSESGDGSILYCTEKLALPLEANDALSQALRDASPQEISKVLRKQIGQGGELTNLGLHLNPDTPTSTTEGDSRVPRSEFLRPAEQPHELSNGYHQRTAAFGNDPSPAGHRRFPTMMRTNGFMSTSSGWTTAQPVTLTRPRHYHDYAPATWYSSQPVPISFGHTGYHPAAYFPSAADSARTSLTVVSLSKKHTTALPSPASSPNHCHGKLITFPDREVEMNAVQLNHLRTAAHQEGVQLCRALVVDIQQAPPDAKLGCPPKYHIRLRSLDTPLTEGFSMREMTAEVSAGYPFYTENNGWTAVSPTVAHQQFNVWARSLASDDIILYLGS